MKKVARITGFAIGAILLVVLGVLGYIKFALPDVGPPPDLKVDATQARLERGEHLAMYGMGCLHCHSSHDKMAFMHPANGPLGAGQADFIPGVATPNLTPTGIGDWSDGELFRAITTGVSKDGRALHPVMPYDNFGQADPEDIYAVIAYLRTLKSAGQVQAKPSFDFPFYFIVNTMPEKRTPGKRPDSSDTLAYGQYLVMSASCAHCHVQRDDKGAPIPGTEFTGGMAFEQPNGTVCYTANLTPCPETGLGKWTKADFIKRFKSYADYEGKHLPLKNGEFNTEMPWVGFSHLSEEDLGAMYTYLHSLKPVKHSVEKYRKVDPKMVAAN
ncbi:MAG: cytochrome c [Cytophagaceae bacterium]|nr:cytochrome c [Cytophagaceae bacterium]